MTFLVQDASTGVQMSDLGPGDARCGRRGGEGGGREEEGEREKRISKPKDSVTSRKFWLLCSRYNVILFPKHIQLQSMIA